MPSELMPSLIVPTLSLDELYGDYMRPPLVWVTVWNVRALEHALSV